MRVKRINTRWHRLVWSKLSVNGSCYFQMIAVINIGYGRAATEACCLDPLLRKDLWPSCQGVQMANSWLFQLGLPQLANWGHGLLGSLWPLTEPGRVGGSGHFHPLWDSSHGQSLLQGLPLGLASWPGGPPPRFCFPHPLFS